MKNIFRKLYNTLAGGDSAFFVQIIATEGSTPGKTGAKMLVFKDGSTTGTIGGGRAEYLCAKKAAEAMESGRSFTTELDIGDGAETGMICGGRIEVCFIYFSPKDTKKAEHIMTLAESTEPAWLVVSKKDGVFSINAYDKACGLPFGKKIQENGWTFAAPLTRPGTVYIFGAGHVSRELAPMLKKLDFSVVVYEEKDELADKFNRDIRLIRGAFGKISVELKPEDYVVIMTSGHWADFEVLEQVLRLELAYTGVIGSRKKMEITRERLRGAGIAEEKINSLHTPIGLPILAKTPAEIAVSIAAELIMHRAERERMVNL